MTRLDPARARRMIERDFQAAAAFFGFVMLAVLIAVLPILFARG